MDAAECHVALSVQSSEKCLRFPKWSHGWDHSAILPGEGGTHLWHLPPFCHWSPPEFSSFLVLTLSVDRLPPRLSGMTWPVVTCYGCHYICLSLSKFWSPLSSVLDVCSVFYFMPVAFLYLLLISSDGGAVRNMAYLFNCVKTGISLVCFYICG